MFARGVVVRVWLSLALSAATACSLFVDLSGDLSRNFGPDGPTDAGTATSDGQASIDGSWCELNGTDATLCEDFDRPKVLPDLVESGGTIRVDTAAWSSPPASLLASAPASAQSAILYSRWKSAIAVSTIRAAADFRIEKVTPGSQVELAKFVFSVAGQNVEVGLKTVGADDRAFAYEFYGPGSASAITPDMPFKIGRWTRVELDVRLSSGAPGRLDVLFDGVPVAKDVALTHTIGPSTAEVRIGIPFANGGHSGWTTRVDNIIIDAH